MTAGLVVVAISDTHAKHDALELPPGDVLVHAGDLTRRGALADVERLDEFLGRQPHRHKIVVAGNHDFCFQREPDEARARITNGVYLEDEGVELEGVRFWGSPWQPSFHDWAFNLPRGPALRAVWERIPADTDVLVTHGPPHGHGDRTARGERVGCRDLLDAVERVAPAFHVFGHIHEDAGVTRARGTTFVNASSCDLRYRPVQRPIVFTVAPRVLP